MRCVSENNPCDKINWNAVLVVVSYLILIWHGCLRILVKILSLFTYGQSPTHF